MKIVIKIFLIDLKIKIRRILRVKNDHFQYSLDILVSFVVVIQFLCLFVP